MIVKEVIHQEYWCVTKWIAMKLTEDYLQCAAGVAIETPCTPGLSYDPENHVCNYPDHVPGNSLMGNAGNTKRTGNCRLRMSTC